MRRLLVNILLERAVTPMPALPGGSVGSNSHLSPGRGASPGHSPGAAVLVPWTGGGLAPGLGRWGWGWAAPCGPGGEAIPAAGSVLGDVGFPESHSGQAGQVAGGSVALGATSEVSLEAWNLSKRGWDAITGFPGTGGQEVSKTRISKEATDVLVQH